MQTHSARALVSFVIATIETENKIQSLLCFMLFYISFASHI